MSVIANDGAGARLPRADWHDGLLIRLLLLIAAVFVYALVGR